LFLPCKVKDFLENNKHFSKKNKKNSEFLENSPATITDYQNKNSMPSPSQVVSMSMLI